MHGPHLRLVPPPAPLVPPHAADRQPDLDLGAPDRQPDRDPDAHAPDPGASALPALDALLATTPPLDDDACARLAALAAVVPGRQRAATALLAATASGAAFDALLALPNAPGLLEALTRCLARGATRRFPPLSLVDTPLARAPRRGATRPDDLSPETDPTPSSHLLPTTGPEGQPEPPSSHLSPATGPDDPPAPAAHLSPATGPEGQPAPPSSHMSPATGPEGQPAPKVHLSSATGPEGQPEAPTSNLSPATGPEGQPAPNVHLSSATGPEGQPVPGPRLPPRRAGAPPRADDGPPGPVDAPRVLALDFRSSRTRSFPDLVRRAQAVADVARSVAVFEALAVADQPGGRIHYRLSVFPDRVPAAALAAALRAAHLDLTWLHARLVRLRGTRLWLNGWSFADDHPIGPAAQAHLLQAWLRWAEQEPAP